jgi:hypothetical protein
LLLRGGPLYVARLVVAVVIDAIERLTGRAVTNFSGDISNELYRLKPMWTFNSATTVVLVPFIVPVVAPLNHGFPDAIERVPLSVSSVAVAIKS